MIINPIVIDETLELFEIDSTYFMNYLEPFLDVFAITVSGLLLSGLVIYGAFKAMSLLKL